MAEQEAADLNAGRVRLADLDSDDDYDYGGKRGNKKKGRRKGKNMMGNNDVVQNPEVADASASPDCTIVAENNERAVDEYDDIDEKKVDCEVSPPARVAVDGVVIEDDLCNGVDDIEISSNGCPSYCSSEDVIEEMPESWRCECCRKDFKSHKQFENHEKSKKHKDMMKKYERKFQKEALRDMIDQLED